MKTNKKQFLTILSIILLILSVIIIFTLIKKNKKSKSKYEKRYIKKIKRFRKENKEINNNNTIIDIIFIGDSLFYGFDLKEFFPEYSTLNRGIRGDTTFGVENRLNVSVFDVKSKIVVMLIGVNNINTMIENYESILIKFKENINDRKIILCSLTPMSGKYAIRNKMAIVNNIIIKKLAKKYDFYFVDLFTPLLNNETNEITDEYTKEGLHFTHDGYVVIAKEIRNILDKIK